MATKKKPQETTKVKLSGSVSVKTAKEDSKKETQKVAEIKEVKEVKQFVPDNTVYKTPTPSYGITGKEGALDASEVYDEADIASALEAGFIAQALERHKEKVAPEKHPDFDGETCVDCGIEIPQVRLDMGKVRCVNCQAELEKINKLYGRR